MKPRKITVLFIDSDPFSRLTVDRTLRYAGYKVIVAERGLDGIDIARTEAVDLILTDLDLPDVTGRELTTVLRSDPQFKNVPIVALTRLDIAEQRELAAAAGINGYLTKPLDVDVLPTQLEFYLQGGEDQIDADRIPEIQTAYVQEVVSHLESRIRELEEKNKDLQRLDRIKDAFIQITAHELRTPLTLIYGYSRLLQETPEIQDLLRSDAATETLVDGLVEGIERMQGIVNEILTISRIMTDHIDLSIRAVNPLKLLQEVIKKYESAFVSRKLGLFVYEKSFPNSIRADGDLVKLVLDNLISNAIKYTPDGGKITIRAKVEDGKIAIHIVDTGIGIPSEEIDQIFERFHTIGNPQLHSTSKTAFDGGGLGLGLAICKGIAEAHGGTITVSSTGRDRENLPGSTFIIVLPLAAQTPSRSRTTTIQQTV